MAFCPGALLGGGLLVLNRSPYPGRHSFGPVLFISPSWGSSYPWHYWRGAAGKVLGITAVVPGAGIGIASALISAPMPRLEFWRNLPLAEKMTDTPRFWERMPTMFAAVRAAGNGTLMAWILQGIMMLGVMAGVYWVWSGKASAASRASILVLGILLFTRYAFIYDYAILAIPLAWLWQEGQTTGWLSLEKPLLLYGWIMPAMSSLMLTTAHWPLSVLMLPTTMALFILVLRRHYVERGKGSGRDGGGFLLMGQVPSGRSYPLQKKSDALTPKRREIPPVHLTDIPLSPPSPGSMAAVPGLLVNRSKIN